MSPRTTYDGFRATIKAVGTGPRGSRPLTFEEARDAAAAMLRGDVPDAQAGAFLIAMRLKGETPQELAGLAQALRDAATPLSTESSRPLVVCAGSFDGVSESPSLSLAAAAVAAACGAGVILACGDTLGPKYGVTIADVLAELGGPREPSPQQSRDLLERTGVTLVHAGVTIAGWRRLAEVRDAVGLRGPFHSAEKLVNWFGATAFIVGHAHGHYAERLTGALTSLGAERAVAVRGIEGQDVLRPGRPVAIDNGSQLDLPEHLGASIRGLASSEQSAQITRDLLGGGGDELLRYTVELNAGLRLYATGIVDQPDQGIALAASAITDGSALATLEALAGRRTPDPVS